MMTPQQRSAAAFKAAAYLGGVLPDGTVVGALEQDILLQQHLLHIASDPANAAQEYAALMARAAASACAVLQAVADACCAPRVWGSHKMGVPAAKRCPHWAHRPGNLLNIDLIPLSV